MTRVAFLTSVVSPFWCDVSLAAANLGIDLRLLFKVKPTLAGRPAHWEEWNNSTEILQRTSRVAKKGVKENELSAWYNKQLHEFSPEVVISSSYLKWSRSPAEQYAKSRQIPLGLWAEKPQPSHGIRKHLKEFLIRRHLRQFDFCLAIGPRAVAEYNHLMPKPNSTYLVPYGQDLSVFSPSHRVPRKNNQLTVLFSGQLVRRHNFHLIVDAIEKVDALLGDAGPHYIFSGSGQERGRLDALLDRRPTLRKRIKIFDKAYAQFEDRSRPYHLADVMLYPSHYSGWGLAVPEAMAAGLPVITTTNVEAARFYVEHGINGVFVREDSDDIANSLQLFCQRRDLLARMSKNAIEAAAQGSAESIADRLSSVLNFIGVQEV